MVLKKLRKNSIKMNSKRFYVTIVASLDETHLDAVRELIKLRGFHLSASTGRVRQSDAASSVKDKQICFVLMPRT